MFKSRSFLILLLLLTFLLISNAVTLRRDKSILFSRIVLNSLSLSSLVAYNNLFIMPLEKGIGIYGGLFNVTPLTQTFNIFLFIISAVILTLTSFYPRKVIINETSSLGGIITQNLVYNKTNIYNKMGEQYRVIEYGLVIVFILCGAVFLVSVGDLVSIFLSIELQSYGLYILSTLYRDSESATSSGLTYFLLGGLSSCFILLGSALLYANSGTTSLDSLYVISSISEIDTQPAMTYQYQPHYISLSLIIMFVGFLFKVNAAPFHFWSPDVYDGIPTIVTTYVAIVAKISILIFFLELVYYSSSWYLDFLWTNVLLLSSLFSLVIGSILGLTQFRIKRLLAYSTISHVGFILLALTVNSIESTQAYLFYIMQYSISNLNAFMILVTIGYTFYLYVYKDADCQENLIDKNLSPVQLMSQIKGYFYINAFLAVSLAITIFSFVGIPPLIGFFGKLMVLSAALDNGYVFMTFFAILSSVVGAAYYLNLIKDIFFYLEIYKLNPSVENIYLNGDRVYRAKDIELNGDRSYRAKDIELNGDLADRGEDIELNGDLADRGENKKLNGDLSNRGDKKDITFDRKNIVISSSLSGCISVLTLTLWLFLSIPNGFLDMVNILSLILFRI